jgi:hypothetical protein
MDGLRKNTAGRLRGRRERKPRAAVVIAVVLSGSPQEAFQRGRETRATGAVAAASTTKERSTT